MAQSKNWGTDWQGNEVLKDDMILLDPENDEVMLLSDVVEYLTKRRGFELIKAD